MWPTPDVLIILSISMYAAWPTQVLKSDIRRTKKTLFLHDVGLIGVGFGGRDGTG